jgi:hypothetical protein
MLKKALENSWLVGVAMLVMLLGFPPDRASATCCDKFDDGCNSASITGCQSAGDVWCGPDATCSGGVCTGATGDYADIPQCGGTAPTECDSNDDCDDSNACTTDTCVSESCTHTPVTCSPSSNPCLDAVCDPASGCTTVANTDPCNDGNVCTANDVCSGGVCSGTAVPGCVPRAPAPAASNWGLGLLVISLFVPAVLILRRRGGQA